MESNNEALSEVSNNVFNLNLRNPYIAGDSSEDDYFVYEDDKTDKQDQPLNHSFENNSSKFYRECSGIDNGDVPSRAQRWIEEKFKDTDSEKTHLFIEQKFDHFFRDCSFIIEPKVTSLGSTNAGGGSSCEFSREDLNDNSFNNSENNFSVYTDKGSENKENKETTPTQIHKLKISNFWKRVDMRQKKLLEASWDSLRTTLEA